MNQIDFTPEELAAFREELFQGFTDTQFNLAIAECKRRNLVPGQHVYFQLRNSSEWDPTIGAKVNTKKLTKVTTIDAFRLISHRTGEYAGQGKAKFYYLDDDKQPTIVSEIPLPHPTLDNTPREPWACSVPIFRKGFQEPVEVVCRFDAYAVTRRQGNNTVLTDMWQRRGPEQLAKCAEAASRRVAYPEELGSFYLSEEFQREDADNAPPAAETPVQPVVPVPQPVSVPAVNHAPVAPTNDPRPDDSLESAKRQAKKNLIKTLPLVHETLSNPAISEKLREEGTQFDPREIGAMVTDVLTPEVKPRKAAKDTKIEDVVLDKVEVVSTQESTPPEPVEPEPSTVQKMDIPKPSASDRSRALMAAQVNRENLKDYVLKKAGKTDIKTLTGKEWDTILTPLEEKLASDGKDAVNKLISEYVSV